MQNKGFIKVLAVLLALVCLFYLSFTFVTNKYYKQAREYAGGDLVKESQFLDSLSTEKVWLGYTFKKAREKEINLGLDLKGGMNVVLEVDVAEVLRSLSGNNLDPNFNQALTKAKERRLTTSKDFVSLFTEEYRALDPGARLAAIFSTFELKDKITPQSTDAQVEQVLRAEIKSAVNNSFNVLRTRIDRFGVVAPNLQLLETDGRILVELPGIKEPERVRKLLQGSANLEFWETHNLSEIYQQLIAANNLLRELKKGETPENEVAVEEVLETKEQVTGVNAADSLFAEISKQTKEESAQNVSEEEWRRNNPLFSILALNQYNNQIGQGPGVGRSHAKDTATVNSFLAMRQVRDLFPRNIRFLWTVKAVDTKETIFELVAIKTTRDGRAPLGGDVIIDAREDFNQYTNSSEVSMTMNPEGAKTWARLTRDNINRHIAIVLDNAVYSFPVVNQEITGGRSQISGRFSIEEAKDLANVLRSGKMSAPVRIISEDVIGPSLGQEAINSGFISFAIAFVALMILLVVLYGFKPGMIANGALLLNVFFLLGVLASYQAVLTLSGIAGVVLALAMAMDANILINERIKEEIRGGKTVKKAIEEGYKKAFSAIFDANLTSIITGVILFYFGTGPIRGFATTLIIGIIVSFLTAVFLTRIVYEAFLAKGKFTNLTFTTSLTKNFLVDTKYNFMKYKNTLYIITIGLTVVCLAVLFGRGLNQGIDFTGGRNYVIRFDQPVNTIEAQEMLAPFFSEHVPSIITIGAPNQVRISTNYKITDSSEGVDQDIIKKFFEGLKPLLREGTTLEQFTAVNILSSQKVGPSIADDMKTGAYWAVMLSVIAIGLYIFLRFRDMSYAVGTIASLIQDAIFILGMYAMLWGILPFSLEVDQTFIAAILTALGYSVNDKVVIFDRIREYTHLYPKRDKFDLFNASLNSTLDRSVNTTVSTLVALVIIFALGGDAIRSFSFAMILGVAMGTLSSMFFAAPIAYEIQKRKQNKQNKQK
ncbi:MAG: protein translocase subunit SecDF [Dysgonamonadaceae bacterium]|jgi:SecD/SecF fusion protein|nr:protein translocase subunit SecDF [Dysgonamonadaceae bacterium]